jgi:hypothetical protein
VLLHDCRLGEAWRSGGLRRDVRELRLAQATFLFVLHLSHLARNNTGTAAMCGVEQRRLDSLVPQRPTKTSTILRTNLRRQPSHARLQGRVLCDSKVPHDGPLNLGVQVAQRDANSCNIPPRPAAAGPEPEPLYGMHACIQAVLESMVCQLCYQWAYELGHQDSLLACLASPQSFPFVQCIRMRGHRGR